MKCFHIIYKTVLLSLPVLLIYAFLFPALNWPDENRNFFWLVTGNYESIYATINNLFNTFFYQFFNIYNNINADWVYLNPEFKRGMGGLRFILLQEVPTLYYLAKIVNIIIIEIYIVIIIILTCKFKVQKLYIPLLFIIYPSVAYNMMQISTDLLYIMACLIPFYLRNFFYNIIFTFVFLLLVQEDRGFIILAAYVFLRSLFFLGIFDFFLKNFLNKIIFLSISYIAFIFIGSILLSVFDNLKIIEQITHSENINAQLIYSTGMSYNPILSIPLLIAGWSYFPSAGEFFYVMVPFYILFLLIITKHILYILKKNKDRNFYSALYSSLILFAFITSLTHVFEDGRYYLFFIPFFIEFLITYYKIKLNYFYMLFLSLSILFTIPFIIPTLI